MQFPEGTAPVVCASQVGQLVGSVDTHWPLLLQHQHTNCPFSQVAGSPSTQHAQRGTLQQPSPQHASDSDASEARITRMNVITVTILKMGISLSIAILPKFSLSLGRIRRNEFTRHLNSLQHYLPHLLHLSTSTHFYGFDTCHFVYLPLSECEQGEIRCNSGLLSGESKNVACDLPLNLN